MIHSGMQHWMPIGWVAPLHSGQTRHTRIANVRADTLPSSVAAQRVPARIVARHRAAAGTEGGQVKGTRRRGLHVVAEGRAS